MDTEERAGGGLPAEVLAAHRAAVQGGAQMYADPVTGLFVMTESALLARGSCCANGCRHCPFDATDASSVCRGRRSSSSCPRCGAQFECGVDGAGCWCADLQLDADALARLAERFEGCLCRSCLSELAVG